MFSLLFHHGHAVLSDWTSVFISFFPLVTVMIAHPAQKDRITKQKDLCGFWCWQRTADMD